MTFFGGLHDYVLAASLREADVLKRLREETLGEPHAIMQITPDQGQFMGFLVRLLGARKALEIGTYTGYSALCLALAMPDDARIVTCDIHRKWAETGRKYWREAGVDHKIDFRFGVALRTMESILAAGEAETFDFVFIDADKRNYDQYYEKALLLLRRGGVVAIDNVLLFGSVANADLPEGDGRPNISDADIDAIRTLNEKIRDDVRVDTCMLTLADGLTLARKR